jgi:ring-1,2-phenylacetyl-CoA epoxidase subunit PaaE
MVLSLFKKKVKNEKIKGPSGPQYYNLTIKEIIKETDEAISILFSNPENKITYLPGQYLTLILNIEGEEVRRSYSLSSSPDLDPNLSVTVKKVDNGKVSNYLVDQLKPGVEVKVMEPMGNFTTEFEKENERSFVLFAGGSGITPLMSIMKSALIAEPKSDITLLYQNRTENSIIYNKLLEELQDKYPDRLRVIHILSQPTANWNGLKGRLNQDIIQDVFRQYQIKTEKSSIFTCGPQGMMDAVESALDLLSVDKKNRHKESFYSPDSNIKKAAKTEEKRSSDTESLVTIILDSEEHEISVRSNEYILETALDADINMPFSCQGGICTSCRGKLLSGNVKMDDPDGLSDEEIEAGYILTCVSHPVSRDVKIEMG